MVDPTWLSDFVPSISQRTSVPDSQPLDEAVRQAEFEREESERTDGGRNYSRSRNRWLQGWMREREREKSQYRRTHGLPTDMYVVLYCHFVRTRMISKRYLTLHILSLGRSRDFPEIMMPMTAGLIEYLRRKIVIPVRNICRLSRSRHRSRRTIGVT